MRLNIYTWKYNMRLNIGVIFILFIYRFVFISCIYLLFCREQLFVLSENNIHFKNLRIYFLYGYHST